MEPKLSENPQSVTDQTGPEKPPESINLALVIMWALWAIGSLYLIVVFVLGLTGGAIESNIALSLGLMYVLVIVTLSLLIRAVSKGKNWARVTYGIFASVSILGALASLFSSGINALISIISLLLVALYTLVMWLLFRRASADWFTRMSETLDTFKRSNLESDEPDIKIPEPKKLRTFIIVVLVIYGFTFLMGASGSYFSIDGTKDIAHAIQSTFLMVCVALTLFTFVKRNRLYLLFALIMSIGGYFATLIYRLFFVTGMELERTDLENILFFALPLLLIILYRRQSLQRAKTSSVTGEVANNQAK